MSRGQRMSAWFFAKDRSFEYIEHLETNPTWSALVEFRRPPRIRFIPKRLKGLRTMCNGRVKVFTFLSGYDLLVKDTNSRMSSHSTSIYTEY